MSYSERLYSIFNDKNEVSTYIPYLKTNFTTYNIDDVHIITTVNHKVEPNAFVVSPYNLIIGYGKEELKHIKSKRYKAFFMLCIKIFSRFFRYTRIDKIQILNNYLFSTNFYPYQWESIDLKTLESHTIKRYPKHGLFVGSVNKIQNEALYTRLVDANWKPIVRRKVYIFHDKQKISKKRDFKKDMKLLESSRFIFKEVKVGNHQYFKDVALLYKILFIDKHSSHNIEYTPTYLELMVKKDLLTLYVLWDDIAQKVVGTVGITIYHNHMTIPILGYDFEYSFKDALYRRLMIYTINYAFERGMILNMGSGSEQFKLTRGAEETLDYMFVKIQHLPLMQRMGWNVILFLSKVVYMKLLTKV